MTFSDIGAAAQLLIGLSFAMAAGVYFERHFGGDVRESRFESACQAGVALLMASFYMLWHPGILVDDAGFIIRYLRQSDAGCWYCFNAADGPMFGISSFSHGAINLLLYRAGLGSPEQCLRITTAVGTFATAFLLLRILRRLSPRQMLVVPLAFASLFGAKSWMMIGGTGMEVPLHSALVLTALLALVSNRGPALWFALSLAVISKLDAVPVAVVFGVVHLWRRRSAWLQLSGNPFIEAALFAGLPLACWIAASTWYFGSPLPHSAAAKLLLHRGTPGHWFPFAERYLTGAWLRFELALFLLLWPWHLVLAWRRTRTIPPETAPGLAFAGLLGLYFVYNPAERMEWYYALPDLFLVLQVLLSLQFVGTAVLRSASRIAVPISMMVFAALCVFDSSVGVRWFTQYLRSLEGERYVIGRYVAEHTSSSDVLLAGHGLPGAWTDATVVDYSGLNSEQPLQYKGDWGALARALRPDEIVVGSYPYYLETLQGLPYRIVATFYEIADQGAPPWQIIRKDEPQTAFAMAYLRESDFSGLDIVNPHPDAFSAEGTNPVWVARERGSGPRFLRMGLRRPARASTELIAQVSWEGSNIDVQTIQIPAVEEQPTRSLHWYSVVIPLDERYSGRTGYRVAFRLTDGSAVRMYAPILTSH